MQPRQPAAELGKVVRGGFQTAPGCAAQQPRSFADKFAAGENAFRDDLRRRAGRRRTQVRHKIRDGEINFMPDGRDDRNRRFKNRPRDDFLVERP